jgi:hypothetical protein
MNPLILSDEEYEAVFERITQLSLDYLAGIDERPTFPRITGVKLKVCSPNHCLKTG